MSEPVKIPREVEDAIRGFESDVSSDACSYEHGHPTCLADQSRPELHQAIASALSAARKAGIEEVERLVTAAAAKLVRLGPPLGRVRDEESVDRESMVKTALELQAAVRALAK